MSIVSGRQLLLSSAAAAAATGISRSLRFNSSDSAYCSRVPASAGNRKIWTWAGWVKRSELGSFQLLFGTSDASFYNGTYSVLSNDNTLRVEEYGPSSLTWRINTTQVFRDTAAWFHLHIACDTTQSTASNRVQIYVNGTLVTALSTTNYPTQNLDTLLNTTAAHGIGRAGTYNNYYFSGYLADIYFIDGQALTPTSFTETDATTGQLIPKAYTGSYGSQGWHLEFADNSAATATTLGKDTSGNGNNWTPNNLSVTAGAGNDSLVDVPTNGAQTDTGVGGEVRGNYCTWNPLNKGANVALSNGNLDVSQSGGGLVTGSIGVSSGKWYWEVTAAATGNTVIGAVKSESGYTLTSYVGADGTSVGYAKNLGGTGSLLASNVTVTGSGINTYAGGDVIGLALNLDAGTLSFYKNGTLQGTSASGLTGTWLAAIGTNQTTSESNTNFGQRPFAYTAPSGFKALCTANLPAPLVTKPNTVFDIALYNGNGTSQTITLPGAFNPDFVWIKNRAFTYGHIITDSVRGNTKQLYPYATNAESTETTAITSFNSDGFSVGSWSPVNVASDAHAAWCWDAGSSTVTNTQGSITSQVRANASAGFSIVKFNTGSSTPFTVGHGLGVKPALIIDKATGAAGSWSVYHSALGATKFLRLNLTNAADTQVYPWNNTEPTSTVFTGGDLGWWGTNFDHICYCFAPVAGYSSFGSYTGNGSSTDGPFVYTGFRPRWVMVKRTDAARDWFVYDAVRNTYNIVNFFLRPNLADAEGTGTLYSFDFLSNGFKLRSSETDINASGGTYIYAAFAESPFNYARAR